MPTTQRQTPAASSRPATTATPKPDPTRRSRDPMIQAFIEEHGLTGAPVLNADEAAAMSGPHHTPFDAYEVRTERIAFDRETARAYLELPVIPGARVESNPRVKHLLGEMIAGEFNWNLVTLARCECEGVTYRINGQNTSRARLDWGAADAPSVGSLHYRVETQKDMRRIYGSFDHGIRRTARDLMNVVLAGQGLDEAIKPRVAVRFASGLKFWKLGVGEKSRDDHRGRVVELLGQEAVREAFTAATLFYQGLRVSRGLPADGQSLMAALLATFEVDGRYAEAFWGDLLEGTHLTVGGARRALNNYLRGTAFSLKPWSSIGKRLVTPEELYRTCCDLWNRDRRGETVHRITPLGARPMLV